MGRGMALTPPLGYAWLNTLPRHLDARLVPRGLRWRVVTRRPAPLPQRRFVTARIGG